LGQVDRLIGPLGLGDLLYDGGLFLDQSAARLLNQAPFESVKKSGVNPPVQRL
jgi:hypothetical protein